MSNWKDLPCDVLLLITNLSNIYTDYVRFRAVCASWRSNLPKLHPKHLYPNIPWLMLPYETDTNTDTDTHKLRALYNPLDVDQVYYLELPEVTYEKYGNLRGSSNGWLVILEDGMTLNLLNPLTKSRIDLPPISSFPDIQGYDSTTRKFRIIDRNHSTYTYTLSQKYVHATYIKKIVFNLDHSMAIAIYGPYSSLAFTEFGDDKWTDIPTPSRYYNFFHDCIFFNGNIYAVDNLGRLEVAPIDNPTQLVKFSHLRKHKFEVGTFNISLVQKGDDLILVERQITFGRKKMFHFNLYKLDSEGWLEINNLDDYTIFLGQFNTSICIPSKYCPDLKDNRIYFTFPNKKPFLGVYDIDDRKWKCLFHNVLSNSKVWSHPSLVVLNPNPY